MVITTPNGETAIVEAKKGNDSGLFGLMESIADEMGLGNLTVMENVVQQMSNTPNATYAQVAEAVLRSVAKVAQNDPELQPYQEAVFKATLATMYGSKDRVREIIIQKTADFQKTHGRDMNAEEYDRFIDILMFDPDNGLMVSNNAIYR